MRDRTFFTGSSSRKPSRVAHPGSPVRSSNAATASAANSITGSGNENMPTDLVSTGLPKEMTLASPAPRRYAATE